MTVFVEMFVRIFMHASSFVRYRKTYGMVIVSTFLPSPQKRQVACRSVAPRWGSIMGESIDWHLRGPRRRVLAHTRRRVQGAGPRQARSRSRKGLSTGQRNLLWRPVLASRGTVATLSLQQGALSQRYHRSKARGACGDSRGQYQVYTIFNTAQKGAFRTRHVAAHMTLASRNLQSARVEWILG